MNEMTQANRSWENNLLLKGLVLWLCSTKHKIWVKGRMVRPVRDGEKLRAS
jgi:hypothetical protein